MNPDYSWLLVPDKFYCLVKPSAVSKPEFFSLKDKFSDGLNVLSKKTEYFISLYFGVEFIPA